jgi:hypothetical protein
VKPLDLVCGEEAKCFRSSPGVHGCRNTKLNPYDDGGDKETMIEQSNDYLEICLTCLGGR